MCRWHGVLSSIGKYWLRIPTGEGVENPVRSFFVVSFGVGRKLETYMSVCLSDSIGLRLYQCPVAMDRFVAP